MEINERDYEFMLKVRQAYENTQDEGNDSIRAVASKFNLSRTKVRKILITLGTIESDITERALKLKKSGKSLGEIADELGCSISTVSTYLPYDTVIYNGEERSSAAIRHEKYRKRNKLVASKQINKNKNTRKEWKEIMKNEEQKVIKLKLELNLDWADMDVLKKYGKVKEGITREVLVPANMNLHALHFIIQKSFGWQNCHLHNFSLPDNIYYDITKNSFLKWADYCGVYFRFPSEDYEDIYWDDDYNENYSVKSWFRSKYSGRYLYFGRSEHLIEAKKAVRDFIAENESVDVIPNLEDMLNLKYEDIEDTAYDPGTKKIEDATCDELHLYLTEGGGLKELLERLKITEVLGERSDQNQLDALVADANKRFKENDTKDYSEFDYFEEMNSLDGTALPLTDELIYEYDYGDGWEVKIKLEDEYYNGEIADGELHDQVEMVATKQMPLCIALDGLPVLDEVGGIGGYCEMLMAIHGEGMEESCYDNPEETKEWARMQGWTGRMNRPDKLL